MKNIHKLLTDDVLFVVSSGLGASGNDAIWSLSDYLGVAYTHPAYEED